MNISIRRPSVGTLLRWTLLGITALAVTRAFGIHTESMTGALFSTLLAHLLGTLLGVVFAAMLQMQGDTSTAEHRHNQAALVGYFTIGTPLFMAFGWLLWQPWLWLTK